MSGTTFSGDIGATSEFMSLNTLPYDLLLNVAQHLDLVDIYALQLTCRSLYDLSTTRPIYRHLAVALLRRCRGLPLQGFQRLSDLSTEQLVDAVRRATQLENAWLVRGPRPSRTPPFSCRPEDGAPPQTRWYKVISAPPNEEVDWLSPITSSYNLCATKSGKVVCWDVRRDVCLAQWDPHEQWELWKCRVEFEIRTVFFTMAKVVNRTLMEFVLMKLEFPDVYAEAYSAYSDSEDDEDLPRPEFAELTTFKTFGVVMNVFLLDPVCRLLSAFIWVSASNAIGLYALLDWNKKEYVFIDTNIECSLSANWSCIFYKGHIVIHSEESEVAHQYFYPISLLQQYISPSSDSPNFVPAISGVVAPTKRMSAPFIFPTPKLSGGVEAPSAQEPAQNPFPFPPWYPESAHFVRQWWPTLASVPRLSCTVVLLADHDPQTHHTRFVLAQHYFKVPLVDLDDPTVVQDIEQGATAAAQHQFDAASMHNDDAMSSSSWTTISSSSSSSGESDTLSSGTDDVYAPMRMWYVTEPFEVVCVLEGADDDGEGGAGQAERPRPLMAVDFGHAVWVERRAPADAGDAAPGRRAKRLRFVSFPPVAHPDDAHAQRLRAEAETAPVHTLEVPEELDLDDIETLNVDQSQGAVIISVREGRIFILCYE